MTRAFTKSKLLASDLAYLAVRAVLGAVLCVFGVMSLGEFLAKRIGSAGVILGALVPLVGWAVFLEVQDERRGIARRSAVAGSIGVIGLSGAIVYLLLSFLSG